MLAIAAFGSLFCSAVSSVFTAAKTLFEAGVPSGLRASKISDAVLPSQTCSPLASVMLRVELVVANWRTPVGWVASTVQSLLVQIAAKDVPASGIGCAQIHEIREDALNLRRQGRARRGGHRDRRALAGN